VRLGGSAIRHQNALSAGNWVLAGTILTVIVSQDPIHVWFDMDEGQYLEWSRQGRQASGPRPPQAPRIPVKVGLSTDQGFPREGVVDFIDNHFDPKTATIRIRAVLPNPDRLMLPGLFVRVRMPLETPRKP
jgi:multidrug efflux pump subunit AcrA (membrane-fusion protein)